MKKRIVAVIVLVMLFSIFNVVNAAETQVDMIIAEAESRLGDTEWTGRCQAFVRNVYYTVGVGNYGASTAADAREMWMISTRKDNIPLGASVYFEGNSDAGHAGIYVGNGYFIHASAAKGSVIKSTLSSDYLGWGWHGNVIPTGTFDNCDGVLYKSIDPDENGKYIRAEPSTSGELLGGIMSGEYFVVTDASSNWGYLTYKDISGYTQLGKALLEFVDFYTCPVVTFNANGGSVSTSSKKVYINTDYGTLPTPTRSGYKFNGWYTSASGGTKITSDTNVTLTSDQTLYAQWTATTYTVEYYDKQSSGGVLLFTQTANIGTSVTVSSNIPTREGYDFKCWADLYSYDDIVYYYPGDTLTSNGNIELYAQWTPTYTLTYYTDRSRDEVFYVETADVGTPIKIGCGGLTPEREGYSFEYWIDFLTGEDYYPGFRFDGGYSMDLYAKWTPVTYTITYDAMGGTGAPAPQTKTHGVDLVLSGVEPTRAGYRFVQWRDGDWFGHLPNGTFDIDNNVTLYAVWQEVFVDTVVLDKTELELEVNDTFTLKATQSPSDALNKTVTWSSSDTSVATVSADGVVTAKAAGTATITVTTEIWSKTATCVVTVKDPIVSVTGISLDKTSVTMEEYDTLSLTATVEPSNATNKSVTWSSSDTKIATVSADGVVTAKAAGEATITVKTDDGGKTAICNVTVAPPAKIIFDGTNGKNGDVVTITASIENNRGFYGLLIDLKYEEDYLELIEAKNSGLVADKYWISPPVDQSTTIDGYKLFWNNYTELATGNGELATLSFKISENAPIGDIPIGFSISEFTDCNGHSIPYEIVPCIITVNPTPVTGISLDKTSVTMEEYDTLSLTATVEPSNATNKSVTWSSSDTKIATVSADGVVTPGYPGVATITATTADGLKTATCDIVVSNQKEYYLFNRDTLAEHIGSYNSDRLGWTYHDEYKSSYLRIFSKVTGAAKDDDSVDIEIKDIDDFRLLEYPYMKIRYKSNIVPADYTKITTDIGLNYNGKSSRAYGLNVKHIESLDETTFIIDIKSAVNGDMGALDWSLVDKNTPVNYVRIKPWYNSTVYSKITEGEYFDIEYIAFFKTLEAADSFTDWYAPVRVVSVTLDKTSETLEIGETLSLTAEVFPLYSDNTDVTWSSSNASVATVSADGVVTAKAAGEATITVTTLDGSKTATCVVTVNAPVVETDSKIVVSSVSGKAGNTVDVVVSIEKNPGVAYLGFNVGYDANALELKSVTANDIFTSSELLVGDISRNPYQVVAANYTADKTNDGKFITLSFLIKDGAEKGTYPITITSVNAYDIEEAVRDFAVENGEISVVLTSPGDATGDGIVDGRDLLRLGKYLSGWEVEYDIVGADVTGDGAVDGRDLLRLGKYLSGWDVNLGK